MQCFDLSFTIIERLAFASSRPLHTSCVIVRLPSHFEGTLSACAFSVNVAFASSLVRGPFSTRREGHSASAPPVRHANTDCLTRKTKNKNKDTLVDNLNVEHN